MTARTAAEVIAEAISRWSFQDDRAIRNCTNAAITALETAANLPPGTLDGLVRGTHVVMPVEPEDWMIAAALGGHDKTGTMREAIATMLLAARPKP